MMEEINFDEAKQSQLPLVEMLINLGYRYIPVSQVMQERGGNISKFILKETAFKKFSEINEYEHKGQKYKFADEDILKVIDELENIPLEGLVDTSKKVFGMIMPITGGKTIKVFQDGSLASKSFKYVDFEHIENNDFAVTVEFEASGKSNIRVDIVLFVNGIPFALIENKKSSVDIEEAINQQLRNQSVAYCPKLFVYPQLLIAANKEGLKYGTANTPSKFYAGWRERELIEEEWKRRDEFKKELKLKVKKIISQPIDISVYKQLLADLRGNNNNHQQKTDRLVTQQDLGVYGLLQPERILDISKNFILYDAGIKKVARYQQYFAIKKILNRASRIEDKGFGKKRQGGIIWHTQGSGKSLTMVMFVKALIENPEITNPRVIIVTDRKDLDRQIRDTFIDAGLKKRVIQASNGQHLLKLIREKDLRVITTLVYKFDSASKSRSGFVDNDDNIFVLIDEAHRSQGGDANLEMNRTIPNACYIAFTGTPLLKKEKSRNKFGNFIDKYTIDDALEDEIILPLIYEGRFIPLRQDRKEIDKQTDRLVSGLPLADKKKLQQIIKPQAIQSNQFKILEVAYDVEKHFLKEFAGSGLKAQIVAPSKYAATIFQKYFSQSGKINTALVISDENGLVNEEDEHKKEVNDYLNDIKANYQSLLSYEKSVIESFKYHEDGIEILIVVDKLLTGFDAPRNTVLYLAKELRDHNLLQAIARVNRLFDNDSLPKTCGFIIDYSENAQNLKTAMQLFGNYDEADVKSALIDVKEKIDELETAYSDLHDLFNGVKADDEAYLQSLNDEANRRKFYEILSHFMRIFGECMVLQDFVHEFDHIDTYQKELKKFMNLRKTAAFRFADRDTNFDKYKQSLIKIMDNNIKADEAELLTRQISISNNEAFEEALKDLGSDRSKAEAIAAQMDKTVRENMYKDPEFYRHFSAKIQKLIEELRDKKIADIEALKQAKLIQEDVLNKSDDSLPDQILSQSSADIFYRNLKNLFVDKYQLDQNQFIKVILGLVNTIKQYNVVDWQTNMEQIRVMTNAVDDYLYDVVEKENNISLTVDDRSFLEESIIQLAKNNFELLN